MSGGKVGVPDCAACPFKNLKGGPGNKPVMGECLTKNPVGVLVGEGPGNDEVEKGRPFVGRTGQWLDARLQENGLERGDLVVLNATACVPLKGLKTDSNMNHAAAACYPWFAAQYEQWKTLPTLAMGKWAGYAANNQKAITVETGRGFVRSNLLVTWHPTYAAFYNPWKAGEFVNDLQRFKRLIDGSLEQPPEVVIHPTVSDIAKLLVQSGGVLACDIETRAPHGQPAHFGKDPTRAELRTIALGTADRGVAYWWGSNPEVQKAIVKVLQNASVLKVFHNGYFFDLRVLARYGVKPAPVIDTRDMRRAVSATSRLSLRYLTSLYSDFAPWKEDEK
jgi:uracil-DNA glycosylase family 4